MVALFLAIFVLFPIYQSSFCFLLSRGYYISYLLLQNLVAYHNNHLVSHSFCRSGIWEQLSWVFMA